MSYLSTGTKEGSFGEFGEEGISRELQVYSGVPLDMGSLVICLLLSAETLGQRGEDILR